MVKSFPFGTLRLQRRGIILQPRPDLPWEYGGTSNCSVVWHNGLFYMVYQALHTGFTKRHLGGYDNFHTSIGLAASEDGIHFTADIQPMIEPEEYYEIQGCQNPRLVKPQWSDKFWIIYFGLSSPAYKPRLQGGIAVASTKDFKAITKHGLLNLPFPAQSAVMFPRKIRGQVGFMVTVNTPDGFPAIVYAEFPSELKLLRSDEKFWKQLLVRGDNYVLFESSKVKESWLELGAPPAWTDQGWILVYVKTLAGVKTMHAALLDLNNPARLLGRIGPILSPEENYERKGVTANHVLAGGAIVVKDELYVYYGAADRVSCLATIKLKHILKALLQSV